MKGRWCICAFKGKWERKKAEFGGELPTALAKCLRNKNVCASMSVCVTKREAENEEEGDLWVWGGVFPYTHTHMCIYKYICAEKINMYLL